MLAVAESKFGSETSSKLQPPPFEVQPTGLHGVGIIFREDKHHTLRVVFCAPSTAASCPQIEIGDAIVSVASFDVFRKPFHVVSSLLAGARNTTVAVSFLRAVGRTVYHTVLVRSVPLASEGFQDKSIVLAMQQRGILDSARSTVDGEEKQAYNAEDVDAILDGVDSVLEATELELERAFTQKPPPGVATNWENGFYDGNGADQYTARSSVPSTVASTAALPIELSGVGVGVRDDGTGALRVTQLAKGGSAEKCNKINRGDILMSIGGVNVFQHSFELVTERLVGLHDTTVQIGFIRANDTDPTVTGQHYLVVLKRDVPISSEFYRKSDLNVLDMMENAHRPTLSVEKNTAPGAGPARLVPVNGPGMPSKRSNRSSWRTTPSNLMWAPPIHDAA